MSDPRATTFARSGAPDVVERELQVFRAECSAKNGGRTTFFKLAAASALGLGLGGFLVGAMSGSGAITVGGVGGGLVLTILFIVMGVSVAPYRDPRRLEKLSEFLRSLDLAPTAPVAVGVDFLELREEPYLAAPDVLRLAQLPNGFVVGRPWCAARATLANGLEIALVRSARTHAFTTRGQTTQTSYSYWLVDAVSITYDPRRFPQLAAAGPSVQRSVVIPQGWEPVSFFAAPGTIAVCAITQHKYAEPDYNPRGALDLARQLTALADPSRAVVALMPQRAPDPAASAIGAVKASGPSPAPWIAMAAVGLVVAGLSALNLSEKASTLPDAMDSVVDHEKNLKKAKEGWEKSEAKRNLESAEERESDEIQATVISAALALMGFGLGGFGALKLFRRRKVAPALGAPVAGS